MQDPKRPVLPKTELEMSKGRRVIVVLEGACVESVKSGKEYYLLNCDDHLNFMKKKNLDWKEARPDITHQVHTISVTFFALLKFF